MLVYSLRNILYVKHPFFCTVWFEQGKSWSNVPDSASSIRMFGTGCRQAIGQACEHTMYSSCSGTCVSTPVPSSAMQGTRKFIIIGFFISGISLFFLGPADFISKPYVNNVYVYNVTLCITVFLPVSYGSSSQHWWY